MMELVLRRLATIVAVLLCLLLGSAAVLFAMAIVNVSWGLLLMPFPFWPAGFQEASVLRNSACSGSV